MKEKIFNLLQILIGNLLISFAISTLILENNIIAGGTSGIGIVLNHYMGIPVSLTVACVNISLFLLGLIFMGKTFIMTSLISTFVFPLCLTFFESNPVFHHYLQDPLLACVIGGVLIGIGIGLILKTGSSTGGIDILALITHRFTHIPVHLLLNGMDLLILALQFTYNDPTHVIYGIITVVISSFMLNKTLTMGTSLVQVLIMSDVYDKIREMLLFDHDAGVTLLASEKGYSKEKSQLLLTVVPYRKLPDIKHKVHQLDATAFIIVSHIDEVGGNGFTYEIRKNNK